MLRHVKLSCVGAGCQSAKRKPKSVSWPFTTLRFRLAIDERLSVKAYASIRFNPAAPEAANGRRNDFATTYGKIPSISPCAAQMTTETTTPAIDPTYGSDEHGLVWAYQFTRNQPGRPITSESVVGLLASLDHSTPDQFLWLHFSLSNSACEHWLRKNLSLPNAFY